MDTSIAPRGTAKSVTSGDVTTELNIRLRDVDGVDLSSADVIEYVVGRLSKMHPALLSHVAWRVAGRTLVVQFRVPFGVASSVPGGMLKNAEIALWRERLHLDDIPGLVVFPGPGAATAHIGGYDRVTFIRY